MKPFKTCSCLNNLIPLLPHVYHDSICLSNLNQTKQFSQRFSVLNNLCIVNNVHFAESLKPQSAFKQTAACCCTSTANMHYDGMSMVVRLDSWDSGSARCCSSPGRESGRPGPDWGVGHHSSPFASVRWAKHRNIGLPVQNHDTHTVLDLVHTYSWSLKILHPLALGPFLSDRRLDLPSGG